MSKRLCKPVVRISPLRPGEAAESCQLLCEVIRGAKVYSAQARKSEVAKYSPELLVQKAAAWKQAVLLARIEGKVAGVLISEIQDGIVWVFWLGVGAEARGLGVARKLMTQLERAARRQGLGKIWCDSRVHNLPVRHLLTDLGYEAICTLKKHWYGQDFMLWQKFL